MSDTRLPRTNAENTYLARTIGGKMSHKYCSRCGVGESEWMACEEPDCGELEESTHPFPGKETETIERLTTELTAAEKENNGLATDLLACRQECEDMKAQLAIIKRYLDGKGEKKCNLNL